MTPFPPPRPYAPRPRPRLAIAVGNGGVRSAAALGLVEVLDESGLCPDAVAGSGSGALVAAAIALGLDRDKALGLAARVWSREISRTNRWQAWLELALPRLAGFDEDFALRDDRRMLGELGKTFGGKRLEELPIPLRLAATDAATGRAVAIRQGSVVNALRASAATPMLFHGADVEGRRLVDGALSDPLALCALDDAQVVIAMGFTGIVPRCIDRPAQLAGQAATTVVNNLLLAKLEAARASGRCIVYVEPRFDRHVGRWETSALAEMHEIGRELARGRVGEIRRLADRALSMATQPARAPFPLRNHL